MSWSHKSNGKENDRQVLYSGDVVARIYEQEHGSQKGKWLWFGQWVSCHNTGICDDLISALNEVRIAFKAQCTGVSSNNHFST